MREAIEYFTYSTATKAPFMHEREGAGRWGGEGLWGLWVLMGPMDPDDPDWPERTAKMM